MIYFIYLFGIAIIITIIFIYIVIRWFINKKLNTFFGPVPFMPVIERAYRAMDFHAQARYFDDCLDDVNDYKKYIIEKLSMDIVREMIKNGCVEINDEREEYSNERIFKVKIKAYKPE